MRKIYLLLVLLAALGCTKTDPMHNTASITSEYNQDIQTFIIEDSYHEDNNMQVVEIYHDPDSGSEMFEKWQHIQNLKDQQADYDSIARKSDDDIKDEEEELKKWCESLHSNSCLELTEIEDGNGCREVLVTCKRYDSDDVCVKYEIDLKQEIDECNSKNIDYRRC